MFKREVCKSEDDVRSPDGESSERVSFTIDGQVVQPSHAGQSIQLRQCADICRRKHQRLYNHTRLKIICGNIKDYYHYYLLLNIISGDIKDIVFKRFYNIAVNVF